MTSSLRMAICLHGKMPLVKSGVASACRACYKAVLMSESWLPAVKAYFTAMASKGGHARAAKLSSRRKKEIAKKAAKARWRKHNGT